MADLYLLFADVLAQSIAGGRKTVTRRPMTSRNSTVDGRPWPRSGLAFASMQWDRAWIDPGAKHHPHQKPVALLQQILDRAPPGPVLDLFAGSGSTGVAADHSGRDGTLVEVDRRWWPVIDGRLASETRQRPLFAEARS